MTREEVHSVVKDILQCHTNLTESEDGFTGEIYLDYRDELSEKQLKEISQDDNKLDAFYEALDEYVMNCTDNAHDEVFSLIHQHWDEDEHGDYYEHEDEIRDYVYEFVSFEFPYDHFLKQDIHVNILVDTGDGNYDYTLNNFASYNASEDEEIEDESSLLWLAEQQGYTREELTKAVFEREYNSSKFLKSVHTECVNVSSHMNALSFFVSMTLKEFIEWTDNKHDIVLSSDTECGLYDCWNGAGGTLEIELEKDVTIPWEFAKPHMDGTRGYGIDDIYGMMSSFWKETVVGF